MYFSHGAELHHSLHPGILADFWDRLMCGLVCWFWCVTINSLRWIGVRQTDAALVVVDRKKARVAAPPTG